MFEGLRGRHHEAVHTLRELQPHWIYCPYATVPAQVDITTLVFMCPPTAHPASRRGRSLVGRRVVLPVFLYRWDMCEPDRATCTPCGAGCQQWVECRHSPWPVQELADAGPSGFIHSTWGAKFGVAAMDMGPDLDVDRYSCHSKRGCDDPPAFLPFCGTFRSISPACVSRIQTTTHLFRL